MKQQPYNEVMPSPELEKLEKLHEMLGTMFSGTQFGPVSADELISTLGNAVQLQQRLADQAGIAAVIDGFINSGPSPQTHEEYQVHILNMAREIILHLTAEDK